MSIFKDCHSSPIMSSIGTSIFATKRAVVQMVVSRGRLVNRTSINVMRRERVHSRDKADTLCKMQQQRRKVKIDSRWWWRLGKLVIQSQWCAWSCPPIMQKTQPHVMSNLKWHTLFMRWKSASFSKLNDSHLFEVFAILPFWARAFSFLLTNNTPLVPYNRCLYFTTEIINVIHRHE